MDLRRSRIHEAQRAGLRNRIRDHWHVSEEKADALLEAWATEARAERGGLDPGQSAYWQDGEAWIRAQVRPVKDMNADDSQDPAITARLAAALAQAPVLFDRLHATAKAGAAPGSEAAKDAAAPLGHHGQILAVDHLSSGIEQLVIWNRLLKSGVQPNTIHMTLVRGAMEGAVTCRWLIDPRAESGERIGRGVALLLEDYRNRHDFERDFGLPVENLKPPAKSGADRRAELLAERTAHKVGVVKVPTMTALFGAYARLKPGPGRAIYRLLSAYAHGKQWKGLTTKIQAVENAVLVPGGQLMKVTANDDLSLQMTVLGVRVATAALVELESYYGAK